MKASFLRHHAVCHKSCYLKCDNCKLQKAEERAFRKRSNELDISLDNPIESTSGLSPVKTRKHQDTVYCPDTCIICSLPESRLLPLGAVSTEHCNKKLIHCATVLSVPKFLGKLTERHDSMSLEAKYHNKCLIQLKNRRRSVENKKVIGDYIDDQSVYQQVCNITHAGLLAHIHEEKERSSEPAVFYLSDLAKLQSAAIHEPEVEKAIA